MAEISTQTALEIERARSSAVEHLQNLGYTISNNATWEDIDELLSNMTANDICRGLINGSLRGNYVDNEITYIKSQAFANCSALTSIQIDNATFIGEYAFSGVSGLTKPLVLYNTNSISYQLAGFNSPVPIIGKNLLVGQSSYKNSVRAPILDYQGNGASSIGNVALFGWTGTTLILRSETPTTLGATSYIPSSVTEVYVPHDLVNTYKEATNWSAISSKIKDLQGSDYESLTWYEGWSLQTP